VGEAGTIAAPAAIVNAVLDALAELRIAAIDMPLTPEKVWTLVRAAREGKPEQRECALPPIFASGAR
jgi:carbon-monoxide dehydrogenase large subunit